MIPAFQPGPVLVETCTSVLAAGCRVVVVDDGSGPEYAPVFQALDARVLLVRHARNRGKGAALKSGLGFVRDACETWGDVVVVTADADGQHRVADVLRVAAVAAEHPGCLVLGTRDFGETRVPTRSRLGNRVASGVFSAATRHRVADTQTGLRACGSALLPVLLGAAGSGFDFEMNVLLVCAATGVELVEVPIETVYVGANESSHFRPVRDSARVLWQVVRFSASSLFSWAVDFALFAVLVAVSGAASSPSRVVFANVVARLVSASVNFLVNRRLVFRHRGSVLASLLGYALLAGTVLVADTLLLLVLSGPLGVDPYLSKVISGVVLFVVSYSVQRGVVFSPRWAAGGDRR